MPEHSFQFSFEVFPPRTDEGLSKLIRTCNILNRLGPCYFSVTFGALGSVQPKTIEVVRELVRNGLPVTPHISCINMTKKDIEDKLVEYIQLGIQRLIVIRGDIPEGQENVVQDFKYASDLVMFIREITEDYFHITVAAYPEYHCQATDVLRDLDNFKKKVDAGADSATTQFFFNSDAYFNFLEDCERLHIDIPIVPGIMPLTNYEKLLRISNLCGAEIPLWLKKNFALFATDEEGARKFGVEVVMNLCKKLLQGGVEKLHFYTLNEIEPTATVIQRLLKEFNLKEVVETESLVA